MNFVNPFKSGLFRNILFLQISSVFFIFIFFFILNNIQLFQKNEDRLIILLSDLSQLGILYFLIKKYKIHLKYFFKKEKITLSSFNSKTKIIYVFIPLLYLIFFALRANHYYTPNDSDGLLKLTNITNISFLLQNLLVLASACIFAPIVEEIIFRGILLHRLSIKWDIKQGIIISSLFFGILHGFSFIPIAILGIIFCLIYLKTNNLYYTIFAHATYNFIVLTSDYIFAFYDLEYIESVSVLSLVIIRISVGLTVPFLCYKLVKYLEKNLTNLVYIVDLPYFTNLKNTFEDLNIVFEDETIKKKYFTLKRVLVPLTVLIVLGILSLFVLGYYLENHIFESRSGEYSKKFKEIEKITEVQINSNSQGEQKNPYIAANLYGGFIVWQSDKQDGDGWGIYTKSFNIDKKFGKEIPVNQHIEGDQINPFISYVGKDKFLIIWQSRQYEKILIIGRFIDSQGKYLGNEFNIGAADSEKVKPIILSNAKNGSSTYYILWKNLKNQSIILKQYNIENFETKHFILEIPSSIKYQNIKFAINNKEILMTGKEQNSIFLYKINLNEKAIEKILKVSDTGFNPNINNSDQSIVTISWEDSSKDKLNYQMRAKNYDFKYKEQKIKTDIIQESDSGRYKSPSSFTIDEMNISLWQNKDIFIYKSLAFTFIYLILNQLNIINDEGIFINNNMCTNNDEIQINKKGYNQQENYSFDHFQSDDTNYLAITWQSKNQDGSSWGIFANLFYVEESDISTVW